MSPQLEAVLMVSAVGCTACAGIVTWAVVATARSRGNWATAASNLANRITDETNHRQQLEERVARLGDRVPGAAEGRMR